MNFMINSLTQSIVNGVEVGSALDLIFVVTLLILSGQKLLSEAINTRFGRALNRALNAPLAAFMLAFVVIAVVRAIDILEE
jgi:hypothetical protein